MGNKRTQNQEVEQEVNVAENDTPSMVEEPEIEILGTMRRGGSGRPKSAAYLAFCRQNARPTKGHALYFRYPAGGERHKAYVDKYGELHVTKVERS